MYAVDTVVLLSTWEDRIGLQMCLLDMHRLYRDPRYGLYWVPTRRWNFVNESRKTNFTFCNFDYECVFWLRVSLVTFLLLLSNTMIKADDPGCTLVIFVVVIVVAQLTRDRVI